MEALAAQKSIIALASTSDNEAIPKTHFKLLQSTASDHWLCCRTISLREDDTTFNSLPLIFDIVTRIAHNNCYLTREGDIDLCDKGESPIVSCWLKACPDDVSRMEWRRMIRRLKVILNSTESLVDTSQLL